MCSLYRRSRKALRVGLNPLLVRIYGSLLLIIHQLVDMHLCLDPPRKELKTVSIPSSLMQQDAKRPSMAVLCLHAEAYDVKMLQTNHFRRSQEENGILEHRWLAVAHEVRSGWSNHSIHIGTRSKPNPNLPTRLFCRVSYDELSHRSMLTLAAASACSRPCSAFHLT